MGSDESKFETRHMDLPAYQNLEERVFSSGAAVVPLEDAKSAVSKALGMKSAEVATAFSPFDLPERLRRPWLCYRQGLAVWFLKWETDWERWQTKPPEGVRMLELTPELRAYLKQVASEMPAPYDGIPQSMGSPVADSDSDMSHGGPKSATPFLLCPPIVGPSDAVAGLAPSPKDESIVAGRSSGFQIWRWCTMPEMRQFIALPAHPLPAECFHESPAHSNTEQEDVVLLELANFQVKWRGFQVIAPMLTLEWNGFILHTVHPERHPQRVGACTSGDR